MKPSKNSTTFKSYPNQMSHLKVTHSTFIESKALTLFYDVVGELTVLRNCGGLGCGGCGLLGGRGWGQPLGHPLLLLLLLQMLLRAGITDIPQLFLHVLRRGLLLHRHALTAKPTNQNQSQISSLNTTYHYV